jgi:hypothetical protein
MLGNGERLTRREAVERFLVWVATFECVPTVLGETSWDTTLLADLMHEYDASTARFQLEVLAYSGEDQAIAFATATQHYFTSNQFIPHHALTDARAFHSAWHSVFG